MDNATIKLNRKQSGRIEDNLEITTYKSVEEIDTIRTVWAEMQSKEPSPVINADIDRYLVIIKTLGSEVKPHIILLKQNDQPAAMIIGRLEQHRFDLKMGYKTLFKPALRCISVVYGGIIGRLTSDICTVLIHELIYTLRRREADVVFFNHLKIDSEFYKLCKTVPGFLRRSHFISPQHHWETHIPNSIEEFYSKVSSSRKRRWKYEIRKLEKIGSSPVKVICYHKQSDVDYFINVASRIEAASYKNHVGVGFISSAFTRPVMEQAARNGWLRAYILYVGDEPCAFELDIQYGHTQFAEQSSFDPKWSRGSPGIVLWVKVLEELCQDSKICRADYGFGDAPYKRQFGTSYWLGESVCIYAFRLRPILINIVLSLLSGCSLFVKRITSYLNLESWVKRNWRKMVHKKDEESDSQDKE